MRSRCWGTWFVFSISGVSAITHNRSQDCVSTSRSAAYSSNTQKFRLLKAGLP